MAALPSVKFIRPEYAPDHHKNNAKTDALTNGLMILRYLFGLRGTPLIAGALGTGAQRTTAAAIEPYIFSLMP